MKQTKLDLKKLEHGLYKSELRYFSGDERGSGYDVVYVSPHVTEDVAWDMVYNLNPWDINMLKNIIDTIFIHSGDLKLDDD